MAPGSPKRMLVMVSRDRCEREASPPGGVVGHSVKPMESGDPCGFVDGEKKKGHKRHIVTDTQGHLIGLQLHPADIQDLDGAAGSTTSIRWLYPWLGHVWPPATMQAVKSDTRSPNLAAGHWDHKPLQYAKSFEFLPRGRVAECIFAPGSIVAIGS
jgi:hypothetical protein